ncbi:DUF6233 domain-containing protein [Streptomyces sp. NPDC057445]|uniref:DUF6233 domain-containing protein n=1 Tax=Streptomyces sp. NPDC057445 TaxID=3346136 RepID=UPI0036806324
MTSQMCQPTIIIELMYEHLAPRVTVTLPGGRVTEGRLHARRQDSGGQWWFEVSLPMPAADVRPIDGENYSHVPTERHGSPAWVLQALRHDTPKRRALVLHRAACWAAEGRLTPASDMEAIAFLRHGWATACDACKPAPEADAG